ncbi:MAG: ATP-dependent helicase HrpB [Desulfuromonadaceae bacterium]|nr:ATP-dependent helicase HrpB [Desulfuromonadaceae bacterium]
MSDISSPRLPVDAVIPHLQQALRTHTCALLQAEPGAGKTTRVPLALLHEPWLQGRRILMLEPRRLAAVHAARYMSKQLRERLGQTVGYTIRHERAVSASTRIEVITEGVLTRRLQHDPELEGVGLIIFDEFHERNIHSDLGLALSYEVQQGLRPELRLLLMSATLESTHIATQLDQCPVLHSAGRTYPVTIHYCGDSSLALAQQVSGAVEQGLQHQGDILVFLPGAGEIRRCQKLLRTQSWAQEVQILPLYGALSFEEQQRAILPGSRRKVVLATNIAETSLTIENIGVVVDSGLERQLLFDVARGMNSLPTRRIAQSSAIQRAGRGGRQRAGHCYRLWSEATQQSLAPHQCPEIMRSDLSALALELACWGVEDGSKLRWIDPPPAAHLNAAFALLHQLGAVDQERCLTPLGRRMAQLPLHPRLARMVAGATTSAEQALACRLAIILEHPHQFRRNLHQSAGGRTSSSDILDILEGWSGQMYESRRYGGKEIERSLAVLLRKLNLAANVEAELAVDRIGELGIGELVLAAYPDRVAQRRGSKREEYLLRSGGGARLSPRSNMEAQEWLVALELERNQGAGAHALIHMGSVVQIEQILRAFPAETRWRHETFWDADKQRVVARRCRRLGALILQEQPCAVEPEDALPLLLQQIRTRGLETLGWNGASTDLYARISFVAQHHLVNAWPPVTPEYLLAQLEDWLSPWLLGITSLQELQRLDLCPPLLALLSWSQQQQLDKLAPQKVKVPSGSHLRVDYADPHQPRLAVKLQELFGLRQSPRVGGGQVLLLLELLSPARRPIQTTTDLANFWDTTYTEVKKELKGRYPKHPWPDDPTTAVAQRGVKRRR